MNLRQDVRLAARMLLRDRTLTLAAVAALTLGIAANNTVFSIVNGALFRDMPFDEPDRIVAMGTRDANGNRNISYLDLLDWQARNRTFEGIAGFAQTTMNVSDADRPAERFSGAYISADAFRLIGHQPMMGRPFTANDERSGADPVTILGYDMWRTRYGRDPSIVGKTIRVNGTSSTVIGVMAEGFEFPFSAGIWQPLTLLPGDVLSRRDARNLFLAGRMREGVTLDQASADIGLVLAGLAREYPETHAGLQPRVIEYRQMGVGNEITTVMYMLLGAVGFVLLIACANVANLLLARAAGRTREVSLRMAIGASRWQIVRQLLIESLLLSVTAGVLGFGLSLLGVRLFTLAVTGTGEPYWLDFSMELRVFAVFASVCLSTAVLFGLAPALQATKLNLSETLNESGRGAAGTMGARRWTGALVVLQLMLAPVLLTGAGLMMRTLVAAYQIESGIDTGDVVVMRMDLTEQQYPSAERREAFYRQLDDRLAALPGMRAVLATAAPQNGAPQWELEFPGRTAAPDARRPAATLVTIGPRYFDALGVPVVRGRDFASRETPAEDAPAIVNLRFVAQHFGDSDPIGQRVRLLPPPNAPNAVRSLEWITIVGVSPNIRQRDTDDGDFDPVVYVPYSAIPPVGAAIIVRSAEDPAVVVPRLRSEIGAIDPDLPLFDVMTLDEMLRFEQWPVRVFGTMFSIFAVIAFVLASVGLYAVTARSVSQRTREIGVRIALGAEAKSIWWAVTRRASIQILIGLAIGMAGATGVGVLLQGIGALMAVSPTDPVTFIGVPLLLALVGLLAAFVPARKAMRLDPIVALRHE